MSRGSVLRNKDLTGFRRDLTVSSQRRAEAGRPNTLWMPALCVPVVSQQTGCSQSLAQPQAALSFHLRSCSVCAWRACAQRIHTALQQDPRTEPGTQPGIKGFAASPWKRQTAWVTHGS